ncbi:MAG: RagB/SusD family nutrient uptake outer membrane protein, partial [Bacteroidales bacterium]|nr:RagB/SusD family nutrient uptake outer membrane protein [Bacteroidales bacterium]
MKKIFGIFATVVLLLSAVSCKDFLNRPSEDSYVADGFYKNDEQCLMGVNYLYSAPWSDVTRFYVYDTEYMSGNVWTSNSPYATLTVNGTDAELKDMSYSLWSINAHCNTVIGNLRRSSGASQEVINQCIGECLAWKAMAYFFLVRNFGDVPIIHDNTAIIKDATYNEVEKVEKSDVYDYIILTLEKAIELLPENAYFGSYNRIDRYAAKGLLAKVYLTKAGVSGELNQEDLGQALTYAEDVILNSGRTLTPKYSDVFRIDPKVFQQTGECLFSWLWQAKVESWCSQSFMQNDVGLTGFSEENNWGDWKGPSIDLQDAFGASALQNPQTRVETDDRRKVTMMMFGDQYDYFWKDKGGFDLYRFHYDKDYGLGTDNPNISYKSWGCSTGAFYGKHIYGDYQDHIDGCGVTPHQQYNQLPTHILRLSDVYLVAAEAALLTNNKAKALTYVNAVRNRAHAAPLADVTFDDVWKERRLELALEGDRW